MAKQPGSHCLLLIYLRDPKLVKKNNFKEKHPKKKVAWSVNAELAGGFNSFEIY